MRSPEIKQELQNPERLSPVNIRETANTLHGMAEDYALAIDAVRKMNPDAATGNMEHKQKACRTAHRLLLFMLGVET